MPVRIARGERVAFSRGGGIFVASWPDLKAARKIGDGQDPAVSRDGRFVAFEEARPDAADRQFVVFDVAARRVVTRHPGTRPQLSPAGDRIAFSQYVKGPGWGAYVCDAALRAKPRGLRGAAADGPAMVNGWVGTEVVTAHSDALSGKASAFALRRDGSVARRVPYSDLAGPIDISVPFNLAWSDDLRRIVFEAGTHEKDAGENMGPVPGVYVYDTGSRRRRQVTPRGIAAVAPLWYRGETIVFTGWPNKPGGWRPSVYGLDLRTGEMTVLIPGADRAAFSRQGE